MGHGYEGRSIDDYVADLLAWDANVVVDVRLNPISRKKGFSKRKLAESLGEHGIEYRHRPELGNPKENREGFWLPGSDAHRAARTTFAGMLEAEGPSVAVQELAELSKGQRVVLLCFEASEQCCHRALVLDAVNAVGRVPALAG